MTTIEFAQRNTKVPGNGGAPGFKAGASVSAPAASQAVAAWIGTGGLASLEFLRHRAGYRIVEVMNSTRPSDELHDEFEALGPYAEQMKTIQGGFGRVMTRLTEVFGVSRQTLYNWLAGEAPKEQHREKLAQLARAAEEFIRQEFKPNAASLERTLVDGKSLLELIQDGAEGVDVARRLIAIERRGAEARSRIDELLAGAPVAAGEPGDFGLPSFDEAF